MNFNGYIPVKYVTALVWSRKNSPDNGWNKFAS